MIAETIARLTGQLKFDVDTAGLRQFQQSLTSISKQMQAIGRQAEALNAKLALKMGIKPADTAAQAKAQKSVIASLDRELKLERLVAQAKRETFRTELAQSKLQFTGNKSQAFLGSSSLQAQQLQAIVEAKQYSQRMDIASVKLQAAQERRQHAATQAGLKAQGLSLKNNNSVQAAKAQQLRSEKLLQLTQAKTQLLQQKQFQSLTATQKIEQVMQHARERSQRLSERFQQQQALSQTRAQRQEVKHQQSQQRFKWQEARQQQWEANKRSGGQGGLSFDPSQMMGGVGLALGGVGAAMVAVSAAMTSLNDRITKRTESVSTAEQWDLVIDQAGGDNKANQKRVKEAFLQIGAQFGVSTDLDAAKEFRTDIMGQTGRGMSLTDAIQSYKERTAAYRGSGMNRDEQGRADKQLRQVRTRGYAQKEDYDTFNEAAPLLTKFIEKEYGKRTGFKGSDQDLSKAVLEAISKRELLSSDYDNAIKSFIAANAVAIEKQNKSVAAEQQRLENLKQQQEHGINTSGELNSAVRENIQAHKDLTAAMQPVNEALGEFDTALMQAQTSLARTFVDSDFFRALTGKKTTPAEDAAKPSLPSSLRDGGDLARERAFLGSYAPKDKRLVSQDVAAPAMPVTLSLLGNSPLGQALANNPTGYSKDPRSFMTMNPELLKSLSSFKIPDGVLASSMSAYTLANSSSMSGSHNVENSNNTVHQQFDIVINAPQNTNVQELSSQLDSKIKEGAQAAIIDAFGAARSQQAER